MEEQNEGVSLKQQKEKILRALEVDALMRERFGVDDSEVSRMKDLYPGIQEFFELCDNIRDSENPEEEIQTMLEILIQKDPEWVEKESGNDPRHIFFWLYFGQPMHRDKVIETLRTSRNNKEFSAKVLASLEKIEVEMRHFREIIRKEVHSKTRRNYQDARRAQRVTAQLHRRLRKIDSEMQNTESEAE